ncbi:hypothetical protein, partial [Mesorhizobium sp. L48C026A00]|uniref:hypothetical protein n=1 Tax=Mesorhizobium sp. L48C026A00 TaxID=1287182 RepID=UPI00055F8B90
MVQGDRDPERQQLRLVLSCNAADRSWVVLLGAVMPFDQRALFWADLPRDAVCDPACSPQQRD